MRSIPKIGKRAFAGALIMGAIGVLATPRVAEAHFVLSPDAGTGSPPAWNSQDSLGLPEKEGPCGDEYDGVIALVTPTNIVTAYQEGQTITVTINEVIFHPGHYRIALAVNDRSELPADPVVTAGATACGSAPIQSPPVFPVLADGVFVHTAAFTTPQSVQITLPPNVTCTKCTLQVIEFMGDHGLESGTQSGDAAPYANGCFYHHCADISISQAGGSDSGAAGSEAGTVQGGGSGDASSPQPGIDSGGGGGGGSLGSDASRGGSSSDASGGVTGSSTAGSSSSTGSSGGCSLAAGRAALGLGCMGGLGAAAMLVRRRRRRTRST